MNQLQEYTNEEIIDVTIHRLELIMHELHLLNVFLLQYIFGVMQIPVNSINYRLLHSLRNGNGDFFIEDMENLLLSLPRAQIERIECFTSYITTNRNNHNLHDMVTSYHN